MNRIVTRSSTLTAIATGALALGAGQASGAVIEVPQERPTIQAAVDAASPGDTVLVANARRGGIRRKAYFENVDVTTNRLKIKGKRVRGALPTIDGTSRNGNTDGNQFDITADDVLVRGFALRHGNGIDCEGTRCTFTRIRVNMSDQGLDCVEIDGLGGRVTNSRFAGCDSNAIDVQGPRARIAHNYIRQVDSACVDVSGNLARIESNRIRNCEDSNGIDLDGDDGVVRGNRVRSTDSHAVDASGRRNAVVGNNVRNIDDDCFDVDGLAPRVERNDAAACDGGYEIDGENMKVLDNRVRLAGDDADFDIDCFNEPGGLGERRACDRAVVRGNLAADNNNDDEGFDISSDGLRGMLIAGNVSRDNNNGGFDLSTTGARIVGNLSYRDGAEANESAFEVFGDGRNRLIDNIARTTGEHGFESNSNRNVLRGNISLYANRDGFHISGNRNSLVANVAFANHGDGIENDGNNAKLIRNRSERNRRDCANDGTIARKTGNRCADGSNFNRPGTVRKRGQR